LSPFNKLTFQRDIRGKLSGRRKFNFKPGKEQEALNNQWRMERKKVLDAFNELSWLEKLKINSKLIHHWSMENHRLLSNEFKDAVRTILMMSAVRNSTQKRTSSSTSSSSSSLLRKRRDQVADDDDGIHPWHPESNWWMLPNEIIVLIIYHLAESCTVYI